MVPPVSNSSKYKVFQPLLLSLMMVIGVFVGLALAKENDKILSFREMQTSELKRDNAEDVIRFIESKYVDDLDPSVLSENAIKGIINTLDPHSVYIPPERIDQLNQDIKGSYVGLGVETIFYNDTLILTNVLASSPAANAGLKVHDRILKINGEPISGQEMNYSEIRQKFVNEKGTKLEIEFLRYGSKEDSKTVGLVVEQVGIDVAEESYMIQDSIGYVKLDKFVSGVYKNFVQALERLSKQKTFKHLIIDLRDNQGGFLKETVKITSQLFKEKELLLVYTEGDNDGKLEYKSTGNSFFEIDKLIILINQGSASGSEIVAAAVQDWDRGVLVGERSFGKGLVQEQFDLNNGGALRLTVARYFSPSGRSIQKPYSSVHHDSLQKDTVKIYKSLKLDRDLAEKGGVVPDVPVSTLPVERTPFYDYLVDNRASIAYLVRTELAHHTVVDQDFLVSDIHLNQAIDKFLKAADPALEYVALTQAQQLVLKQKIKRTLCKQLYGRSVAGQMNYTSDPVIEKAIDLIDTRDYFAELN